MNLEAFVRRHSDLFVITGAGCSTASGIPDYRDGAGLWKRRPPVQLDEFVGSARGRARYWSRSMLGWPAFSRARPNRTHYGLVGLAEAGYVAQLVTQNVDGLHQRAGQRDVIDLHGRLDRVRCLDCGSSCRRAELQPWLERHNPLLLERVAQRAPDGDADLDDREVVDFAVPGCPSCGGTLKPDVVFYGESVPRSRVADAYAALERSSAVLIVGSSVMVFSSYRFCKAARAAGKPIAAVNRGVTRADDLLSVKVDHDCGEALAALLDAVTVSRPDLALASAPARAPASAPVLAPETSI